MNKRKWPIAPDAFAIIGVLAILGLVLDWLLGGWGWLVPGVLILFTLFFFRNPERRGLPRPMSCCRRRMARYCPSGKWKTMTISAGRR